MTERWNGLMISNLYSHTAENKGISFQFIESSQYSCSATGNPVDCGRKQLHTLVDRFTWTNVY